VYHTELDAGVSTLHWPRHPHQREQLLDPGEIVPVWISLWPLGMIWEAGETLRLSIGGFNLRPEGLSMLPPVTTLNAEGGKISIHTGGAYDSHLVVPFVPQGSA